MTVGQLKAKLATLPDDLTITVRASDDEADQWVCGGIVDLFVDYAHDEDDTPFVAIEVNAHEPEGRTP